MEITGFKIREGHRKEWDALVKMYKSGYEKAVLAAACIESTQSNLFMFNPKLSYPAESVVKADPAFWNQKATAK